MKAVTIKNVGCGPEESRGKSHVTSMVRLRNWATKSCRPGSDVVVLKDRVVRRTFTNGQWVEKVLYEIMPGPAKPTWTLTFWVHETWEGDDMDVTVDFYGDKPSPETVEATMRKAYRKYSMDGDSGDVFQNMKNDFQLREHKPVFAPKPSTPAEYKRLNKTHEPSLKTMQKWLSDGVAKATDGCRVEPDGYCPHGKPSWILKLGYC